MIARRALKAMEKEGFVQRDNKEWRITASGAKRWKPNNKMFTRCEEHYQFFRLYTLRFMCIFRKEELCSNCVA